MYKIEKSGLCRPQIDCCLPMILFRLPAVAMLTLSVRTIIATMNGAVIVVVATVLMVVIAGISIA